MIEAVAIHTDEIALKGKNRSFFEKKLVEDIERKLNGLLSFTIASKKGTVTLIPTAELDDASRTAVVEALRRVFGIAYFITGRTVEPTMEAINDAAIALMRPHAGSTFRATARRRNKAFPLESMDIAKEVGAAVLENVDGTRVDLHTPAHTVRIEIDADDAFVGVDRHEGAGGLPVGTAGVVATMLSGGIDSPVAAWKMMRRGAKNVFVHFHSYPYVGMESVEKVKRLAKSLTKWQGDSVLYLVPFGDLQRDITAKTSGGMRVILYRRFMLRIAERIAAAHGALALVAGDALGQVASQTLENMRTVSAAVRGLPVHRPLIGDDKRDITDLARRIGTFEISIEPHDDCCTLFVPSNPELRSSPEKAQHEESLLDVEALITTAIGKTERIEVSTTD